jgi:hypothetical protein
VNGSAPATFFSEDKRPNAVPEPSHEAASLPVAATRRIMLMTAHTLVGLIEEMMDLKVQQYAESQMKLTLEVATFLKEKHETDKRRLDQIKSELERFLET